MHSPLRAHRLGYLSNELLQQLPVGQTYAISRHHDVHMGHSPAAPVAGGPPDVEYRRPQFQVQLVGFLLGRHAPGDDLIDNGGRMASVGQAAVDAARDLLLYAPGRRTDTNAHHTLMIVHEWDGSWSIHCPDAPGVQLNPDVMICVAESILKRARRGWIEGMR